MASRARAAKSEANPYDDSSGYFHGSVQNLRDVITFESKTKRGLREEFAASVADYEEMCKKAGVPPETPAKETRPRRSAKGPRQSGAV